jgi:hypothetical protein
MGDMLVVVNEETDQKMVDLFDILFLFVIVAYINQTP